MGIVVCWMFPFMCSGQMVLPRLPRLKHLTTLTHASLSRVLEQNILEFRNSWQGFLKIDIPLSPRGFVALYSNCILQSMIDMLSPAGNILSCILWPEDYWCIRTEAGCTLIMLVQPFEVLFYQTGKGVLDVRCVLH